MTATTRSLSPPPPSRRRRSNFVDAPYFITNPSICDAAGNPVIPPVPSHGGTVQGLQQFSGYGWVIPVANVASILSIGEGRGDVGHW